MRQVSPGLSARLPALHAARALLTNGFVMSVYFLKLALAIAALDMIYPRQVDKSGCQVIASAPAHNFAAHKKARGGGVWRASVVLSESIASSAAAAAWMSSESARLTTVVESSVRRSVCLLVTDKLCSRRSLGQGASSGGGAIRQHRRYAAGNGRVQAINTPCCNTSTEKPRRALLFSITKVSPATGGPANGKKTMHNTRRDSSAEKTSCVVDENPLPPPRTPWVLGCRPPRVTALFVLSCV